MENKVIAKEYVDKNYIYKDVIRKKIEELTKERKYLISKENFEVEADEITATNVEGINDLINYHSKGIMVKILREILEDK